MGYFIPIPFAWWTAQAASDLMPLPAKSNKWHATRYNLKHWYSKVNFFTTWFPIKCVILNPSSVNFIFVIISPNFILIILYSHYKMECFCFFFLQPDIDISETFNVYIFHNSVTSNQSSKSSRYQYMHLYKNIVDQYQINFDYWRWLSRATRVEKWEQ